MAGTNYQYDKLPQGRWFRLLHIHPGLADDPLVCDLVTVDLDSSLPYKALSYVWGDPNVLAEITCSGSQRPVTVNLFDGLQHLRSPDRVETVWADAICINQGDNDEKAHQVNLMGVIYDRAAEVVVWLGKDPGNLAESAFEGLRTVNAAIQNGTHMIESVVPGAALRMPKGDGSQESSSFPVQQRRSNLRDILKTHYLRGIKELFQLAWFTRVWVLQEVGLATEATAFWGDSYVGFSEIAMFILFSMTDEHMDYALGQDVKDIISGSPYYAFWSVWSTYNKRDSWVTRCPSLKAYSEYQAAECRIDFLVVLEASRRFNATNALDHVFAFLGHPKALVPTTNTTLVQADYNISLETLHGVVASRLAEQSLNFLVQVQNQPANLKSDCSAPSWIPAWNVNNPDSPNAFWEAWDSSLRATTRPSFKAQAAGGRLHVSAILFDTVSCYTDRMEKSAFDRSSSGPGRLAEQCWALTEESAKTRPHVYGDDALLSLALTLICHHRSNNTGRAELESLLALFVRFCAVYNGDFWRSKLEHLGISFLNTPLMGERRIVAQFQDYGTNRRFFVSSGGYWGLGPSLMQEGDICAILFGADVPFILRPTAGEGRYRLVGQAYICGAMYGELVENLEEGKASYEKENICLV
ncbi:heterokaryon incompatibility protein [Colletotrichum tabaci]|uniref:Heterokaryon incompatibility protein n=1 Tax=Colletotrichum tabaci TaxID=1209068 RepID=A0AAV9TXL4_9PEZI